MLPPVEWPPVWSPSAIRFIPITIKAVRSSTAPCFPQAVFSEVKRASFARLGQENWQGRQRGLMCAAHHFIASTTTFEISNRLHSENDDKTWENDMKRGICWQWVRGWDWLNGNWDQEFMSFWCHVWEHQTWSHMRIKGDAPPLSISSISWLLGWYRAARDSGHK